MGIISIYVPEKLKAKFLTEFDDEERKEIRKEASDLLVKKIKKGVD